MLNALKPCLIMNTTGSIGSAQQMAAETSALRNAGEGPELCFYIICLQLAPGSIILTQRVLQGVTSLLARGVAV